jgi:DNA-binding response OmpR family regulator
MILIIEDNRYTQHLLKKQLRSRGFESIAKDDGHSGLAWLQENKVDLVILDVMLPDADGIEICRQIRSDHPKLPIVVLSALGNDSDARSRGIAAGANDFVAKPYLIDDLIPVLRALLSP